MQRGLLGGGSNFNVIHFYTNWMQISINTNIVANSHCPHVRVASNLFNSQPYYVEWIF